MPPGRVARPASLKRRLNMFDTNDVLTYKLERIMGSYSFLLGGSRKLTNKPMALKQLKSSPVAVRYATGSSTLAMKSPSSALGLSSCVRAVGVAVCSDRAHSVPAKAEAKRGSSSPSYGRATARNEE